jgi:hypothetical protein
MRTPIMREWTRLLPTALLLAALCACAPPGPTPEEQAAAAAAAIEAQANTSLELYRTLLKEESWELAAPIGQEVVDKYPSSAAAKEIATTLAEARAKGEAVTARRRLQQLWIYQSGEESGGQQNVASIYSSDRVASARVRLVLRRHTDWGQSVYLFGAGKGFECRGNCSLDARVDGKPRKIRAYLPATGEPALFIRDDKAFLATLEQARRIELDVVEKGRSPRTLVFEVGGFDATRWPLPEKPANAAANGKG